MPSIDLLIDILSTPRGIGAAAVTLVAVIILVNFVISTISEFRRKSDPTYRAEQLFSDRETSFREKEEWLRSKLDSTAEAVGGQVIRREDSDQRELTLEIQLKVEGRPTRIYHTIDEHDSYPPTPGLEMEIGRARYFYLKFEEGAQPVEPDPDDMFADKQAGDSYVFVAPELMIDEDEVENFRELPERAQNDLIDLAAETGGVSVGSLLSFSFPERIHEYDDYAKTVQRYIDEAADIARAVG